MLDILIEIGIEPAHFLLVVGLSALIMIFAYKRFLLNIFDPLVFFIITMIADSTLLFGLSWPVEAKLQAALFLFLFWLGFALCGRIPQQHSRPVFSKPALFEAEVVLLLMFVIVSLANLYLGATVGFPLFSVDPTMAKVQTFQGGLGSIRRLNEGPYYFLASGCVFFMIIGYRRTLAMVMLLVSSAFIALSGSKGALLAILFLQAFAVSHRGLRKDQIIADKLKVYAIPTLLITVFTSLVVSAKGQGGLAQGLVFLVKRLVFYGDVVLFYYPRRGSIAELAGVGFRQYLQYLLNPILGLVRLVPYADPLGSIIAGNLESGFGPNVQFFVRADIFFGTFGGGIYCFINGWIVGFLRKLFFVSRTQSPLLYVLLLMIAVSAPNFAAESQLFVTYVLETLFLLLPLWVVSRILRFAVFEAGDNRHFERSQRKAESFSVAEGAVLLRPVSRE